MGVALIAKGEDFSGISVGSLGIYTSIQDGLQAFFEFRKDIWTAQRNRGFNGQAGSIVGSPTIGAKDMITSQANHANLNFKPGGNHTVAAIFKIRDGSADGFPFAAFGGSPTSEGAEYFWQTGTSIKFESTVHYSGGEYAENVSMVLAKPTIGNVELYAVTLENGVGGTLHHPRTGATASDTVGPTTSHNYPNPPNYLSCITYRGADETVYAFAYWNRVLSDLEISTFYSEVKAYYSQLGVTI